MMDLYNMEYMYFALNESRGVIDNYYDIGEEIYNKLNDVTPQLIDSETGLYLRALKDVKIDFECFIERISVMYYTYISGKSDSKGRFIPYESNNENLTKSKKLINSKIVLYERTDTPEKMDKYHFMDAFSHEIAHAYRYYSILCQNNSNIPDSIKKENNIYASIANIKNFSNEKARMFINGIIYLIDKDETAAFSNETYEQLRQNEHTNRGNIHEHFNDFRMYRNITLLKTFLSNFDKSINNEKSLNEIRTILNELYGTDYTNNKGIKLFRQKIVREIIKMSNQFIKVIEKGLIDFNRCNMFYKEHFSERELNLILENFNI